MNIAIISRENRIVRAVAPESGVGIECFLDQQGEEFPEQAASVNPDLGACNAKERGYSTLGEGG